MEPNIKFSDILRDDFDKNSIKKTELNPPNRKSEQLAFTLENVLTAEECKQLIEGSEQSGYTEARIGSNQGILVPDYRKGLRFMIDDKQFVSKLWSRICDQIPDTFKSYKVCGLNERLRFLRYDSGDFFNPHWDACYIRPDGSELSLITIQIYLNEGFSGGETTFLSKSTGDRLGVVPKTGMILVFDQTLFHEGSKVIDGRKYTIRTEVMFKNN
jgi:predicted 2-oxoglutarate/Fe(II)-dependent dioxygenase YbiX